MCCMHDHSHHSLSSSTQSVWLNPLFVVVAGCCCAPAPPTHSAVLDTKVISRAAGSAYMELGDTKVMAAV